MEHRDSGPNTSHQYDKKNFAYFMSVTLDDRTLEDHPSSTYMMLYLINARWHRGLAASKNITAMF